MPRRPTEALNTASTWQLPERTRTWRAAPTAPPSTASASDIGQSLIEWGRTLAPGVEFGWDIGWDGEKLVTHIVASAPEVTLGAALPVLDEAAALLAYGDLTLEEHQPGRLPPVVASILPGDDSYFMTHGETPGFLALDRLERCLRHLAGATPQRRRRGTAERPLLAAFRVRISHRRTAALQATLEELAGMRYRLPEPEPFREPQFARHNEIRKEAAASVSVRIEVLAPRPLNRIDSFLVGRTWEVPLDNAIVRSENAAAEAVDAGAVSTKPLRIVEPGTSYVGEWTHGMHLLAPGFVLLKLGAPRPTPPVHKGAESDDADEDAPRGRRGRRSFPF